MWKKIFFWICLLSFAVPGAAIADDLWDVYLQAKDNDAKLQKAEAEWFGTCELLPQSTATLLPTLSANANSLKNDLYTLDKHHFYYNSHGYNLSLSVPLFNLSAFSGRRAADWRVRSAGLTFVSAQQDLITRAASAYFSVLLAREKLSIKQQEVKALSRQLSDAQARFAAGLITKTNTYEIESYLQQARSALVSYEDSVQISENQLATITDALPTHLQPLSYSIPLKSPIPNSADQWVIFAEKNNADYLSAYMAANANGYDVKARFYQHLPNLNLTSNLGRNATHFEQSLASTGTQRNIGLQLSIPLYSGGQIQSQLRQARHENAKAEAERRIVYRRITRGARQLYFSVSANIRKIKCDTSALNIAQKTLANMKESYKAGTRSVFDVLFAQQRVFSLREQLILDKVDYINNSLALKRTAGLLCDQDIYDINQQFLLSDDQA